MKGQNRMTSATAPFVEYAVAVGDAFLTLDSAFVIRRAEGVFSWLGLDAPARLLGRSFLDFLDSTSRERVEAFLAEGAGESRIGPLLLQMKERNGIRRECVAFLSRSPSSGPVHVVLAATSRFRRFASELSPSLLGESAFMKALAERGEDGKDTERTLAFLDWQDRPDAEFARDLACRASEAGAIVGQLSPHRFAVLHEGDDATDRAEQFARALKEKWGPNLSWAVLTVEMRQLTDPEGRAALRLLLHRFASTPDMAVEELHLDKGLALLAGAFREVEALHARIAGHRFDIVYQPIVSLADGSVHHYEALLRIPGEQGPGRMIGLAEQSGLIPALDYAIVDKLLRRIKGLGAAASGIRIAANLSAFSLLDPDFLTRLLARLEQAEDGARHLLFEVTESARIDDVAGLGRALETLRENGFPVCLDDFGAGMSGFQYLRDLPVDFLKIDGSYVKGAPLDPRMHDFLDAILALAEKLAIPTIAEWVETAEEAAFVRERGVVYAQGFHFGRPSARLPRTTERRSRIAM